MATGKRAVIVGSSFAGYTAALDLRKRLDPQHEVLVIDARDHFTFIPSLVWLPFGIRQAKDVTFKLAPVYEKHGITFRNGTVDAIDTDRKVLTVDGADEIAYDVLLVATGPRLAFEKIPGLGPETGYTQSVCNLDHALATRVAWQRFLADPGPVVIGAGQGASCFGASYEFMLNTRYRIEKAGLSDVAPVTFITAEPFVGHFGLGGVKDSGPRMERYLEKLGVEGLPNTVIKEVRDGEMELDGGRVLPFKFSMIIPPFGGVAAVTQAEGLANPAGFIPVDDRFHHPEIDSVYAAGVCIAIAPPEPTPVPAGVPKTGHMSEGMGKVAAANMAAEIQGGEGKFLPLGDLEAMCILDAGNGGFIFKADHILSGPRHPRVSAGPHAHVAKVAFERFWMSTRRRGKVLL